MAELSDLEVETIVGALEKEAIGYSGAGSDIQGNRAVLLDRYNRREFGDEIEGQSKVVTSDVFEVVEGMLPGLIRLFMQNRDIAKFRATKPEAEKEAQQKTRFANWVFQQQHDPLHLLLSYCKDALLQYTGTLKVYWDDSEEFVDGEDYANITKIQLQKLKLDPNYKITDEESFVVEQEIELPDGSKATTGTELFNVQGVRTNQTGKINIEPIPPNEVVISKRARDWKKPPFYGQNTPKTRSELIQMGFDRKLVKKLGEQDAGDDGVESSRFYDVGGSVNKNPTTDKSQDIFRLGEYYAFIDKDQDGIAEYYQIFFISGENKLLEMNKIDDNPFATATPIPMPHRSIGECPASLVADHQYWKSTLVRNLNNNIYSSNFVRLLVNDRVDDDELLTPTPGGIVHVDGVGPVSGNIEPIPTVPQAQAILSAIEYADTVRESRTGVTRYNQGMDTESLNKTATGFQGIRDMASMRLELIARVLAEGLRKVFNRIIELATKHQHAAISIVSSGKYETINPSEWKYKTDCMVDIGTGGGERQERIANLNFILEQQKLFIQAGSPLADPIKMYATLDKIAQHIGLLGAEQYFNNPEIPQELMFAELQRLAQENQLLQQQMQNPLAEAEAVKGQTQVQLKQVDAQLKIQQEQLRAQIKSAEMEQKDRHHDDKMTVELTKIEADSQKNIEGSLI